MPACSDETASREATMATMPSLKSRAVTPRASLVLMSEATDSVPNTAPQGTHEVRSRKTGTKAPQCAKLALCSEAEGLPLSADAVLMQLQRPRAFPKPLATKLEPKHYPRLITFAAT